MDIKNLIDAIASGNTKQADETFASLMTAKADQAVAVVYDHAAATFMESEEEQIDEISNKTIDSYMSKSYTAAKKLKAQAKAYKTVGQDADAKTASDIHQKRDDGWHRGLARIVSRNGGEEAIDHVNTHGKKALKKALKTVPASYVKNESVDVNEEQKDAE